MGDYEQECADWIDNVYRPWYEANVDGGTSGKPTGPQTNSGGNSPPPPPPPSRP